MVKGTNLLICAMQAIRSRSPGATTSKGADEVTFLDIGFVGSARHHPAYRREAVKGFAHRQQTHARRITTDTLAGAGDAPLHCSLIVPKVLNAAVCG